MIHVIMYRFHIMLDEFSMSHDWKWPAFCFWGSSFACQTPLAAHRNWLGRVAQRKVLTKQFLHHVKKHQNSISDSGSLAYICWMLFFEPPNDRRTDGDPNSQSINETPFPQSLFHMRSMKAFSITPLSQFSWCLVPFGAHRCFFGLCDWWNHNKQKRSLSSSPNNPINPYTYTLN